MAPSTLAANVTASPIVNHLIQFNPSSQLPIKLFGSHYFIAWTTYSSMLLHGHDLYSHLVGTPLKNSSLIKLILSTLSTRISFYKIIWSKRLLWSLLMPQSHPSLLQQKTPKLSWITVTPPLKTSLKRTSLSFITISFELDKTKNLLLTICVRFDLRMMNSLHQ